MQQSPISYLISGWTWLYRFVMSTFADGVPGGTGRFRSSTSSAMQPSQAKVITGSPGSLDPTSPSVDANVLATGARKALPMAAADGGSRVSLVEETPAGAIRSRPALCSLARRARMLAHP